MSLKRILGTMLATRMAGRGRRRGFSASDAMLGGLGYRRRPRIGGKLGLAALGYMAYRAYQDHQSRTAGGQAPVGGQPGTTGATGGGLGGMISGMVDSLTGSPGQGRPQDDGGEDLSRDAAAAEAMDESKALLLIRGMIAAAYADGAMSEQERRNIMGAIDEAGGTDEDRQVLEREIANPKSLDTLLSEVNDQETAEEFYLASAAAIDGGTELNRRYLDDLRRRLDISEEDAAEAEDLAQ